MLCPVCKTECGAENVCKECGFDQLQVEFLNCEEATYWMENVVLLFRIKWQSNQKVDVGWKDILLRQKEIRYFFDVTILAAERKNEVLGHTLLICPYKRLRDCFIEQLKLQFPYRNIKKEDVVQRMTMGEFAAALSSLQPGDIYSLEPKVLPVGKKYTEDIIAAFKEFVLIVRIRKGPSARVVRLELPPFTFLAIANKMSEVPKAYLPLFENIIEIKVDKYEACKIEMQLTASELELKILPSAIDMIASETKYDIGKAISCIKHINDFMFVKGMVGNMVTVDLAKEVISQFM